MTREELEIKRQELQKMQQELHLEGLKLAEEEKLEKLAAMPLIINVMLNRTGNRKPIDVFINNKDRTDVLSLFHAIPSRYYDYTRRANEMTLEHWEEYKDTFYKLPNTTILIDPALEAYIEKIKQDKLEEEKEPTFSISIENSRGMIVVKAAKRAINERYYIGQISGNRFNNSTGNYEFPQLEAWRLFNSIRDLTVGEYAVGRQWTIEWSEELLELIKKQSSLRNSLDDILKLEDAPEIDPQFLQSSGVIPRPFQRVGIKFAISNGGRILIADQVGLGKTIQALGILQLLKKEWLENHKLENGETLKFKTVIIVPAAVKENWYREIVRLIGIKPYIMWGLSPSSSDIIDIAVEQPEIILTNYNSIRATAQIHGNLEDTESNHTVTKVSFPFVDLLNDVYRPNLVIGDEIHYIKDTSSKQSQGFRDIKSDYCVLLSATPVMNRPTEFYPILSYIDPISFGSKEGFGNRYSDNYGNAKNMAELHELVKPVMIRRLKKDVQKDLPPIEIEYHYHELSKKGRKIYEKALRGVFDLLDEGKDQQNIQNILVQIQRCKQICAVDALNTSVELSKSLFEESVGDSHRKVIIASQYVRFPEMVGKIYRKLNTQGEALYITGEDHPRSFDKQQVVDEFMTNDRKQYLVVSSKGVKEGLNITAAGFVVFHDLLWTPMAHDQIIGRAYGRENDPHTVNVHYIVCVKTIMEDIVQLLNRKSNMFSEVVDGIESSRGDSSIISDLIDKLKSGDYSHE